MAEYTFDYTSKEILSFEPFLPVQDFSYAKGIEYSSAAQEIFVRQWQKTMQAPPTTAQYESGAWGCNTDTVINPIFNVILGTATPTQRQANLATSMIKWFATHPGQNLIKLGQHLQKTFEKEIHNLTSPQWPKDGTQEKEQVRGFYGLMPNAMFILWVMKREELLNTYTWGITPLDNGKPRSPIDTMTTAEFIALEPANFNADGNVRDLPVLSDSDIQTMNAVAKWLGTDPQNGARVQNMISGQEFLEPCLLDIAKLSKSKRHHLKKPVDKPAP